jgi:PEP-CTERM motif
MQEVIMPTLIHRVARLVLPVVALAFANAAQSATYIITYTGTAQAFALDVTGVFGPAGASLTGKQVTAVYTLTDPTPGAFVSNNGIIGETYGGTLYGRPIPVVSSVTINGVTRTVAVDTQAVGIVRQINDTGYDQVYHHTEDRRLATTTVPGVLNVLEAWVNSTVHNIVNSSNYTDPLDYTVQPGDGVSGYFSIYTVNYQDVILENAYGNFSPERVTIQLAAVAAVPEPASWMMLIVGFGVVGATLRRRHQSVAGPIPALRPFRPA